MYYFFYYNPKKAAHFQWFLQENTSDFATLQPIIFILFYFLVRAFKIVVKTKLECGQGLSWALPQAFNWTNLEKKKKITTVQLQVEWDVTCDLIWNLKAESFRGTAFIYIVDSAGLCLKSKAMTVFCTRLFWRFKPFNGSFHLSTY